MTSRFHFTVTNSRPIPFKRHAGQGRRAHNDPAYTAWREEVGWAARAANTEGVFFDGDVLTVMHFRIPDRRMGDLDNYVKGVHDALEGILYGNDKQVKAGLQLLTVDADQPGVDVWVSAQPSGVYAMNGLVELLSRSQRFDA